MTERVNIPFTCKCSSKDDLVITASSKTRLLNYKTFQHMLIISLCWHSFSPGLVSHHPFVNFPGVVCFFLTFAEGWIKLQLEATGQVGYAVCHMNNRSFLIFHLFCAPAVRPEQTAPVNQLQLHQHCVTIVTPPKVIFTKTKDVNPPSQFYIFKALDVFVWNLHF